MPTIAAITQFLEQRAPLSLQESYDNAGLITGNPEWECTGILCTLDATEQVIAEAIDKGLNLVVAHHPIVFKGLKRINGRDYVERTIIRAIKHDIAIYAIHTNLDNVLSGVNGRIAAKLGLQSTRVLAPISASLKKLVSFVPQAHLDRVRDAVFAAGAGQIGNYSECSFSSAGTGTFKGNEATDPFVGKPGERHLEPESRFEVIVPAYLESLVVRALLEAHPYEEVAYDLIPLSNTHPSLGAGLVGVLPEPVTPEQLLKILKSEFSLQVIRHTAFTAPKVQKIAVCGGAGSFLLGAARAAGADVYITADMKYHEFFDADGRILVCDIGHFESEQFTVDLLHEVLEQKFPTFAVLKSAVRTNPVHYYLG